MRTVLPEALLVAVVGMVLAFVANQASPRGLDLSRDYFRTRVQVSTNTAVAAHPAGPGTNLSAPASVTNSLEASLRAKGLQTADLATVRNLFEDPRYRQSAFLFVDARNDQHYQEGHVPGAFQLDYYRPDAYLPLVIPMAQIAEKVIVYCNGGTCEDSELATLMLRDAGIPAEKVFVFVGGFAEWAGAGLPVESGVRDSGTIRTGSAKR